MQLSLNGVLKSRKWICWVVKKHCRVREPNIGATSGGEGVDPQSAIKQAEHNSTLVSYCYVTVRTQALAPYLTPTSTASA